MVDFKKFGISFKKSNKVTTYPVREGDADLRFTNDGSSGTLIYGGYYEEEYLRKLQHKEGMDVYDTMRRSDPQVKMILSVVKNPILSAKWDIEAVDDSEEEQEIAEFVRHCLFYDIKSPDGRKRKTFKNLLREGLSFVDFGFSCFEVVHKVVYNHPRWGDYIGLRDIAWRSPKTIERWELAKDGSIKYVVQQVEGDFTQTNYIDGKHLLVFTNDKEGDNYEGISLLRSVYGNHFRKNLYRKLQAIGLERSATGVPMGELDENIADKDAAFTALRKILKRFTSHQESYIATPAGVKISEMKMTHDSEALQMVVDAENVEMTKSVLANFMEMGISGSGSYSLGTDLSDIFLSGIELYADIIEDGINSCVIEKLVKMKFGEREYYPVLKVSGINDKAGKELAEIISMLAQNGLVQKSERLYKYIATRYDLPEYDNEMPPPETPQETPQLEEHKCGIVLNEDDKHPAQKQMDRKAPQLEGLMRDELKKKSDNLLMRIDNVLSNTDDRDEWRQAILEQKMRDKDDYEKKILTFLAEMSIATRNQVFDELNLPRPNVRFDELEDFLNALPKKTRSRLMAQAALLASDQFQKLETTIFFTANSNIDLVDSARELVTKLEGARDDFIVSPTVTTGSVNIVSEAINNTRNDVMKEPDIMDTIDSFIFYNPSPVAPICKQLAGRVFSKEEYEQGKNLPPLHHNCSSVIIAQSKGGNNQPISDNGLSIVGTPEEVQKATKSITFK